MNTHAGVADIERDIRDTRARMDSTIEALKTKLSPGELVDHALGYIKESGAGVGQSFARRVRDNPLPLTVMAASLLWLMMSERRLAGDGDGRAWRERTSDAFERGRPSEFRPEGERRAFTEAAYREPQDFGVEDHDAIERYDRLQESLAQIQRRADETAEAFNQRYYQAKGAALDLRQETAEEPHSFRHRVDQAFHALGERAGRARRRVGAKAARLGERSGRLAQESAAAVKHRAASAADRTGRYFEEHPLVIGALGLAAGALAGSLLPRTAVEDRSFGKAGEAVRRRSAQYAREAAGAAGDAARSVAGAAAGAAQREGLTREGVEEAARDVAERAARVGEETIEAGREAATRPLREDEPGRS